MKDLAPKNGKLSLKQNEETSIGRPRKFDREAALQTAMKLFGKHGFEGVSISDLTREIGIGPPSLYAAFGNKEMLYREALAFHLMRQDARKPEQDASVRVWLRALLCEAAHDATDPDFPQYMVALGMLNCSVEHNVLAQTVAALRANNLESLVASIIQARNRGELSGNIDARAFGRYVMALTQGIFIQAHDGATYEELLGVVDVTLAFGVGHGGLRTAA